MGFKARLELLISESSSLCAYHSSFRKMEFMNRRTKKHAFPTPIRLWRMCIYAVLANRQFSLFLTCWLLCGSCLLTWNRTGVQQIICLGQKGCFFHLHSETLRLEYDIQWESESRSSHRKLQTANLTQLNGRWGERKYQKYIFFWQAFSSKMGLILPFEKKIISMLLFSRTRNWSHFPSERRNLLYIITNGQEKWASVVPRVVEYSLSCNLSEYFGCLFFMLSVWGVLFW